MNKKEVIALVRGDIKKHQDGEMDEMPTVSQYAKRAEISVKEIEKHLRGLNEEEQAYCYSHEKNNED